VVRAPETGTPVSELDAGSGAWVRFRPETAVLVTNEDTEREAARPHPAAAPVEAQGVT
jgi:hypothetical protein